MVKWLWEETHVPKVMGSNTGTVYCMDIFSPILVVKNCDDLCLKRPKINEKEAGLAYFLKKNIGT